jgi:ribonuclease J
MGITLSKITVYGGVNEIGGNKILVETENGSVLLDFGRRMGYTQDFYSEFLQIRSKNALRDMIKLGILPRIDGVYAPHLVDTTVMFEDADDQLKVPIYEAPDYWKLEGLSPCNPDCPAVDAVFVSHAHFDHIQDVSFLDPIIPVYCTEVTKIMAKAMSDISASHVDDQYYEIGKLKTIKQKSESYRTLCPCELEYKEETGTKPEIEDEKTGFTFTHECTPRYRSFKTEPEGQVKGISYKMIPVGHSLPGACSILLTLPDGKHILYTGDLRFHGANEISIDEYVEAVGGSIDIMITEGTRIESTKVLTEEDIAKEIASDIGKAEGLVLINFGWKDLSRFNTIYDATTKNDRVLVISPKLAYLLYEMHINFPAKYDDPREMPKLKVYLKREGCLLYSKADYDKFKMGYLHFHGRNKAKSDRNIVRIAEKLGIGGDPNNNNNPLPDSCEEEPYDYQEIYDLATHHLENGIKAYEIRENPEGYVLMFSYWDANELFDLIPDSGEHKTQYICASTEPFNEEMEIDETKFMNWLNFFQISYEVEVKNGKKIFSRKHISGHASKLELKELIEKLNPTKIIPIHTTKPELFEEMFGEKVTVPKYAEVIVL